MANHSNRLITLTLPESMVGQIIDACIIRETTWADTAAWLEGATSSPDTVIDECRDADEARSLAIIYADIIQLVSHQRALSIGIGNQQQSTDREVD